MEETLQQEESEPRQWKELGPWGEVALDPPSASPSPTPSEPQFPHLDLKAPLSTAVMGTEWVQWPPHWAVLPVDCLVPHGGTLTASALFQRPPLVSAQWLGGP